MDKQLWRAVADGLRLLAVLVLTLVICCAIWRVCDRISWVRFTTALPCFRWLRMILWGWV